MELAVAPNWLKRLPVGYFAADIEDPTRPVGCYGLVDNGKKAVQSFRSETIDVGPSFAFTKYNRHRHRINHSACMALKASKYIMGIDSRSQTAKQSERTSMSALSGL